MRVHHFHYSVQNVFQAVRHSLRSKSLSVDAAVYTSGALSLHYVSLSWLLCHQYRYQNEQQPHLATYEPLVEFLRESKG